VKELDRMSELDHVQMAADRSTVWVHASDGSTVGRFSLRFGMDVHTTVSLQLQGASQCLHCTHSAPTHADWLLFCDLMARHYGIAVPPDILSLQSSFQKPAHEYDRVSQHNHT
jgi:hypothetical protein